MFGSFEYYRDTFGGTKIKTEGEYNYLGRQASRYILKYTSEVTTDTKDCESALVEYIQNSIKQGNMTSETIPNYYSVSWSSNDTKTKTTEINGILELYLGDKFSSVGIVKLIN